MSNSSHAAEIRTREKGLGQTLRSILRTVAETKLSQKERLKARILPSYTKEFTFEGSAFTLEFECNYSGGFLKVDASEEQVVLRQAENERKYFVYDEGEVYTNQAVYYSEKIEDIWSLTATVQEFVNAEYDEDEPIDEMETALDKVEELESMHTDLLDSPTPIDFQHMVTERDGALLSDVLGLESHISNERGSEAGDLFRTDPDALQTWLTDSYLVAKEEEADEAFVFGCDDTPVGTFIHAVDGRNIDPNQGIIDGMVRSAMDFTYDLDADKFEDEYRSNGHLHGTVRLQGDLAMSQPMHFMHEASVYRSYAVAREFDEIVHRTANNISFAADFSRAIDVYFDARPSIVSVSITEGFYELLDRYTQLGSRRGGARTLDNFNRRIEMIRGEPSQEYDPRSWQELIDFTPAVFPDTESLTRGFDNGLLGRERIENSIESEIQQFARKAIPLKTDGAIQEMSDGELTAETVGMDNGRLNLPIDNHLLIFENADIYPTSSSDMAPVSVIVPEYSEVTVFHGEHDTKTIPLTAGIYRFDLLRRGVTVNERDAPGW